MTLRPMASLIKRQRPDLRHAMGGIRQWLTRQVRKAPGCL